MCDRLYPIMACLHTRDLFKSWQVNDGVWKTVEDRVIVTVEV